jgi:hypothetical protein
MKRTILAIAMLGSVLVAGAPRSGAGAELDPYVMRELLCRFPFAQVIPLDSLGAWGILYGDTYGKLHLLRATPHGWKLEWEMTSLGAKIRRFFVRDLDGNGVPEIIIASVAGRILVYSMDSYQNTWENFEDHFSSLQAIEVANVDDDPQLEFVYVADGFLYIVDGISKNRQWVSQRTFDASELIVGNVDKDPQMEIILNSGIIIDSRFLNVEVSWDKPFGDRIGLCDLNSDGIPEVIGEFADYSLRVFDVYARRELW